MLLRDMVVDGYTGLLVDPNWREPAIDDPKVGIAPFEELSDAIALKRPTSDLDDFQAQSFLVDLSILGVPTKSTTGDPVPPLWGTGFCTNPTITVV